MPHFIIRYSGRGTGVLRTEAMVVDDASGAVALVCRRLVSSRIFQEAAVFEEEECLFNVTADGVAPVRGDAASP